MNYVGALTLQIQQARGGERDASVHGALESGLEGDLEGTGDSEEKLVAMVGSAE